jgi:hypothetical protein
MGGLKFKLARPRDKKSVTTDASGNIMPPAFSYPTPEVKRHLIEPQGQTQYKSLVNAAQH